MIPVFPIVAEMRFATGENVCTSANHVFRPGELLAVKNKGLPVFIESSLAISAFFLQSLSTILLVFNLGIVVIDDSVISMFLTVVFLDLPVVILNAHFEVLYVVSESYNLLSESF